MRRSWIPTFLMLTVFFFGCRFYFVSAPESADPSQAIKIVIDLMPDINLNDGSVFSPVVCLGKPVSWTISEVSYAGMSNSTVEIFGFPAYSSSNSMYMNTTYPIAYTGESGDWSCYLGQEASWTRDAEGSVTFKARTGHAGAFTIYVSAGVDDPYGPDWSMIEKRVGVGQDLEDLEHWVKAQVDSDPDYFLSGVAYGGGKYVAVGWKRQPTSPTGRASVILYSNSGKDWSEVPDAGNTWLEKVHYGDGRFVVVGQQDMVLTSANGESWEEASLADNWWLTDVTYGNGTWVGIAGQRAQWAEDINSWSSTRIADAFDLHGITFAEDLFVAVGGWTEAKATIFTSPDGQNWTLVENTTTGTLYDIAYGDGRFVAVGDDNIYYSDDLSVWNLLPNPASGPLYTVAWLKGRFVAAGEGGSMFSSPDGAQWTRVASGTSLRIEDIAEDGKRFVAAGDYGLIMLSSNPSGGGSGGCSTAGPKSGEPAWPEMLWTAMLGGLFVLMRRGVTDKQEPTEMGLE